jgi:hypothetical protein
LNPQKSHQNPFLAINDEKSRGYDLIERGMVNTNYLNLKKKP